MTPVRLGSLILIAVTASAYADTPPPLDRDHEIALALEAGPASVTAKAGVWVHDKTGYIKARDSQNGFVCVVDHRVPAAVEPQCMDAEGVKTFFPKYQLVASLRAKGKPEADIRTAVKTGFKDGTFKAPSRPGVIYMMSPHNVVTVDEEKGIAVPFPGHLMFYAPNLTSARSRIGWLADLAAVRRRREDSARADDRPGADRRCDAGSHARQGTVMKRVMVRYTVKPEHAADNVRLVEAVFAQLARDRPAGIRYATFKLPDGVSFVHLASIETTDGSNPLGALEAFKAFVGAIKERCIEPPVTTELAAVGSYRLFDVE